MRSWAPASLRTVCALLVAGPLLAAVAVALGQVRSAEAWQRLVQVPGLGRSLGLSLFTAVLSTVLAGALALLLVTAGRLKEKPDTRRVMAWLGPLLALPHAAFAIGLLWLFSPAGWLARALAPLLGSTEPPDWRVTQDPWGLGLVAVLVCKELPFLMWNALALLQRPDVAEAVDRQMLQARCLGLSPAAVWWRLLWPAWGPRLAWPALAVLAYGLTVVDVALIIGPGSPPTLAVWAWEALNEPDPGQQAAGAAAAWLLALMLPVAALVLAAAVRGLVAWQRARLRRGIQAKAPAPATSRTPGLAAARALGAAGLALYAAVVLALGLGAFAGPWPFPELWPQSWHTQSWAAGGKVLARVGFTAALAAATAALSLTCSVVWLACTPAHWDRASAALLMLPLLLPPVLLLAGLYPLALRVRLDGQGLGLLWAHLLMALPYAHFVLVGPWRSLDPRLVLVARLLGHGVWRVAWRVQLPLLRAPLAAAAAVAFAVSVAQYLPTQFIGAGRLPTVTTEAVTLAAAGQRGPASAQALLQIVLPLLGFALAAALGRRAESAP